MTVLCDPFVLFFVDGNAKYLTGFTADGGVLLLFLFLI